MGKLSDLLSTREITAQQENLPKGKIYSVTGQSGMYACIRTEAQWCWNSPGCGIAVIEMWGASGTGSCNCCCSVGLPGNTGAYTKKTISVTPCSVIFGRPGVACNGPGSGFAFAGCSEASCLVWEKARDLCGNTNGCMCAQGGVSGRTCCFGSSWNSPFCCFMSIGFCGTLICNGCGIICNVQPGLFRACGYGGDINKCGLFSKMEFRGCQPMCTCLFLQQLPFAPGVFSEDGGYMSYHWANDHGAEQWAGSGMGGAGMMINYTSKQPTGGTPWSACWRGDRFCTCYEAHACINYMPYGVPGTAPTPCPDVRDSGRRGGAGAIRVTYRGTNVNEEMAHVRMGEI